MTISEKHLVLDLETLGTKINSCILSIGAIIFDPYQTDVYDFVCKNTEKSPNISTYYKRISLDSCEKLGMTIDDSTVEWWAKQSKEAQDEAFSDEDRHDIKDALKELNIFSKHCKRFWAKSPDFDCKLIESYAFTLNIGVPWQFWETRCIRTIEDHIDFKSESVNSHHALQDTFYEAASVQAFYQKIGCLA
jgi:hypothetical protein